MSPNINSMMYVGKQPWHVLGTKLENAATSMDAIKAAGLDWKVDKIQDVYTYGNKGYALIEDHCAVVRRDTEEVLGVVGNVYRPLQNVEAFSFFDAIVGIKEAMYHTAGALGKGERVWILAKLPGYIQVKTSEDITEKFLLLTNRHDGLGCVEVMFTPIRVVCQNTLNIAVSSGQDRSKIRHSSLMAGSIEKVRENLGIINAKFSLFEDLSNKLSSVVLTSQKEKDYFKNVLSTGVSLDNSELSTRTKNRLRDISDLFNGVGSGSQLSSSRGTAWGAFNAVSEWVDYYRQDSVSKRANSLLFGSGADIKQRAWDKALQLV